MIFILGIESKRAIFNLCSEAILREIEVIPGFIINSLNINNIRYTNDRVLIAIERKLQELVQKVMKEGKQKGLN